MDHTRHSMIYSAHNLDVTLIGCGGIGSAAALALAKMGVGKLELWDADYVNSINLATQLHALDEVNNLKVEAVERMIAQFSDDTEVSAIGHHVNGSEPSFGYVIISAVDSISARKEIWASILEGGCSFYLDARMAAEELQLYCVDMRDPTWYEDMLGDENDASIPDLPCTAKATFFCGMIAGGMIGSAVKKIATSQLNPKVLVLNMATNNLTTIY
jgi:molybdopterin/thiamine biosynthesis adenylyltransferase